MSSCRRLFGIDGIDRVGAVAVGVVGVDAAVDVVVDAIGAAVAGDDEHLLLEAGGPWASVTVSRTR